jgi:hypothetical protein
MVLVIVYIIPAILALILSIIYIKIDPEGEDPTRGSLIAIILAGLLPILNIAISIAFTAYFILNSKFMDKFHEWLDQPVFKKKKDNR